MNHKINENILITSSRFMEQKEFWLNRLPGNIAETKLLRVGEQKSGSHDEVLKIKIPFSGQLSRSVIKLARQSDIAIYLILLSVLKSLIYRYAGNEDITVISPVHKEYVSDETMNDAVYIRDNLGKDTTFKELLLQVKNSVLDAYDNQDYPSDRLLEMISDSTGRRELHPISNVVCAFTGIHNEKNVKVEKDRIGFVFTREDDRIAGSLIVNRGIYDENNLQRLPVHFITLLEHILQNIDEKISQIPMMPEEETKQLLDDFNRTGTGEAIFPNVTVHRLFREQARKTPDRIAVLMSRTDGSTLGLEGNGTLCVSYKELDRRSDRLAVLLMEKGVGPGTIAGILLERSIELITAVLGILKAGGAYLPLDPDYPEDRIKYILTDSAAKMLITKSGFPVEKWLTGQEPIHVRPVFIDTVQWNGINSESPGIAATSILPRVPPTSLAYVLYTSGSTGRPKGVSIEHRNVVAYIHAFLREFKLTSDDIVMQQASSSFDVFVEEVYPILTRGGKSAICQTHEIADLTFLSRFIQANHITLISCTPLLLNELNKLDCHKSISTYISGGDELKPEHIGRIVQSGNVYNTYGPTETTVCVTYHRCTHPAGKTIPIGKPIAGYKVYILDKNRQPVPVGVPGEMFVTGAGLARGYLNRPRLTEEKFITNPFDGGRMYGTGDLAGWLPNGRIQFLGRVDRQVKLRGFRIELTEIERVLGLHPSVEEALVTIWQDETGDKHLCAYYVHDKDIPVSRLREFLAAKLPDYMIPSFFMRIPELKLTASGKPDRAALPAPVTKSETSYVAPSTETEELLVELWSDILGMDKDKIGTRDNFFQLGGHSLKATILMSRVYRALNVKTPLKNLFNTPTVREFAAYIDSTLKNDSIVIDVAEKKTYYPLSSAQKRLYILQQMDLRNTVYNMPFVISLAETPAFPRVQKTLKRLVQRHESLRTSFHMSGDQPVQYVHPPEDVDLDFEYFEDYDEYTILDFVRPFDLSRAPLLRVGLVSGKTGAKDGLLLLDMHHIVSDGVSMGIMKKEFLDLYSGRELPQLRIQYKDFANWENSPQQRERVRQQETFWIDEFQGTVPLLNMPIDYERPDKMDFKGSSAVFFIDEERTEKIKSLTSQFKVSLTMFLISIYAVLLSKYTGQDDIIVGTVVAGRRHPDLESIIGFFVNMLPVRVKVDNNIRFSEFLNIVKEKMLSVLSNQDYQFEELVGKLEIERESSRHPLVDTVFVLHEEGDPTMEDVPQLAGDSMINPLKKSHFDLMLHATASGHSIRMALEYSTALFKRPTIEEIAKVYMEILEQVTADVRVTLDNVQIAHDLMVSQSDFIQADMEDWDL